MSEEGGTVELEPVELRRLTFLEVLADGGHIEVNGIPWREAFDRMEALYAEQSGRADG